MPKILKKINLHPSVQHIFQKSKILTTHNKLYRISRRPNVLNSIQIVWKNYRRETKIYLSADFDVKRDLHYTDFDEVHKY